MPRDPHVEHPSPTDGGAAVRGVAHTLDNLLPNGGRAGRQGVPQVQDAWLDSVRDALPRAIHRLPEAERRLVVGRFYEERPVEELAQGLQLSPDRARTLLQGALRMLREQIGN